MMVKPVLRELRRLATYITLPGFILGVCAANAGSPQGRARLAVVALAAVGLLIYLALDNVAPGENEDRE